MNYPDFSDYTIKWASSDWELAQSKALRRQVFCAEQGLFEQDDADDTDASAQVLVAVGSYGGWHQQVVGTVRIHQQAEGLWYGSRLAVDSGFRTQGYLGPMLIKLAVGSARVLGAERFMATVQAKNLALFKRLNWQQQQECIIQGQAHLLMAADLNAYTPCYDPYSGYVVKARRQRRYQFECTAVSGCRSVARSAGSSTEPVSLTRPSYDHVVNVGAVA